jgi:hypothetical protein
MGETSSSTGGPTIKDSLKNMGYTEIWRPWSLLNNIHPDANSRGGLRVWGIDTTVDPIS